MTSDHYFDICCHGIPWVHCGCDDPGFDVDPFDDELICAWCGEAGCDGSCTTALVLGPNGREALGDET